MVAYTDPTPADLAAKEETPRRESKPRRKDPVPMRGAGYEISRREVHLTHCPFAKL